jgi:Resolvase, N terminal domain
LIEGVEGPVCHPRRGALRAAFRDQARLPEARFQRPALQELLANIRDGLIDVVVVYKVDRLTRSLAEFLVAVGLRHPVA